MINKIRRRINKKTGMPGNLTGTFLSELEVIYIDYK
jgi:hypothetical protein